MRIKWILFCMILGAAILLSGCGESKGPTENELAALNQIFQSSYKAGDLKVITKEVMNSQRKEKFQALDKVLRTPEGDYAFISKPVAYNGPITLAVGIDKERKETIGMKIVEHLESEDFVRDMTNRWFTDRFTGKDTSSYLELNHLEAVKDNQIVIITGATVTTQGITNGVNACMGLFNEIELGKTAEKVAYKVKFKPGEGDGLEESGAIAIRRYGVVLGKVNLEEIRQMPSVTRTMSIHSTKGTTNHRFKGTLLSNVIAAVDPKLLTSYKGIKTIGVDSYMSNIAMEEVNGENSVYLMYEDNGRPLKTIKGKTGAMRVIVLDDVFGQRFTNNMIEIVVE